MEIKAPFYNLVNIFMPGLVFIGSCILLFLNEMKSIVGTITGIGNTGFDVIVTVSCFAIAYEVGYILFRLGAVFIEPILRRMFGWSDYNDFIAVGKTSENAYKKLDMLSREYGYARTQILLFVVLSILTGIRAHWWIMGICICCIVLFAATACGHMKRLQKAVKKYLTAQSKKSEIVNND